MNPERAQIFTLFERFGKIWPRFAAAVTLGSPERLSGGRLAPPRWFDKQRSAEKGHMSLSVQML
jgi:hypothetical protein